MPFFLSKFPSPPLRRLLSTTSASSPPPLQRISDELLSLSPAELSDFSSLLRLRLGLSVLSSAPSLSPNPNPNQEHDQEAQKEKTAFDVKIEKFDAASKIKVIKEVRGFTDLGLKEAKELVEKAPIVVKSGVAKEEGEAIVAKLKAVGATVVLE